MSGFSTDDGQSAVVSISGLAPKLAKIDLESGVTQKQFGHHKIGDEVRLVGAGPLCAVSSWHANEINFWNYETEAFYGKMEVPRYSSWVASRDGRHLAILHHDTIEFWDLPLLKRMETISLDGFMAANVATFSRDGDFLYTRSATNRVCVIDMAMKRIVLRIDEDKHVSPNSFQFLSSGELAEVNASIGRVRLWNLRGLNRRFQDLHIGWRKDNSSRFFLPEPGIEGDESSLAGITSTQSFGTLALKKQLERVHFETNAETDTTMSLDAKAQIKMLEKKLKDSPRNISLLNQLAWTLLVAPPQLRDDQKAVELAQSAASSNPDDPNVRNTLALSLFRVHRNAEAKKLLQENLKSQPSIFLHLDLIILSMVEIREGDFAKSELFAEWANRSWLDNAASSGRKWLEFQMLVDERNTLLQSTAH